MTVTESDIITGNVGFDAIVVLSVLTAGYYDVTVIADEAGLPIHRTLAALSLLIGTRKASSHVSGWGKSYALYGTSVLS